MKVSEKPMASPVFVKDAVMGDKVTAKIIKARKLRLYGQSDGGTQAISI